MAHLAAGERVLEANAASKKAKNHAHAVARRFMRCPFGHIHKTPRVTPAMAAGVTDRLWELADIGRIFNGMGAA